MNRRSDRQHRSALAFPSVANHASRAGPADACFEIISAAWQPLTVAPILRRRRAMCLRRRLLLVIRGGRPGKHWIARPRLMRRLVKQRCCTSTPTSSCTYFCTAPAMQRSRARRRDQRSLTACRPRVGRASASSVPALLGRSTPANTRCRSEMANRRPTTTSSQPIACRRRTAQPVRGVARLRGKMPGFRRRRHFVAQSLLSAIERRELVLSEVAGEGMWRLERPALAGWPALAQRRTDTVAMRVSLPADSESRSVTGCVPGTIRTRSVRSRCDRQSSAGSSTGPHSQLRVER